MRIIEQAEQKGWGPCMASKKNDARRVDEEKVIKVEVKWTNKEQSWSVEVNLSGRHVASRA